LIELLNRIKNEKDQSNTKKSSTNIIHKQLIPEKSTSSKEDPVILNVNQINNDVRVRIIYVFITSAILTNI
jgi:hypothetical protein